MKKLLAGICFLAFSVGAFAQTATQPRPIETILNYSQDAGTENNIGSAIEAQINQNQRYRVAKTSTDAETIKLGLACQSITGGVVCAVRIKAEYPDLMSYDLETAVDVSPDEDTAAKTIYNHFINDTNDEGMNRARSALASAFQDLKKLFSQGSHE